MTAEQIDREAGGALRARIDRLRRERNAVILAHNYQLPEVQDIADYVGDSLGLSQQAATTSADVIVFCGVHFMAETAAILSPDKTVLLPDLEAGCSLADTITADQLRAWKAEHPGAVVVSYVNTTAEVKAESDYCCTSSNAAEIVATEVGILHRMERFAPHKRFLPASREAVCRYMKMITPEKIATALERMEPQVSVPPAIADRARVAIERMLAVAV